MKESSRSCCIKREIHTTTMKVTPFLIAIIATTTTTTVVVVDAFNIICPPTTSYRIGTIRLQSTANTKGSNTGRRNVDEDMLSSLQHEYKVLQEKLLEDLIINHDGDEALKDEEHMLEVAIEATKLQEHRQKELIKDATHDIQQAEDGRQKVLHLKEKTLNDAFLKTLESKEVDADDRMVESYNEAYEDLQRYNEFELTFDLQELEAKHKLEASKVLLKTLKENETKLQATLDTMKAEEVKMETTTHYYEQQHRSILNKIKDAIYAHPDILTNLDPHIF